MFGGGRRGKHLQFLVKDEQKGRTDQKRIITITFIPTITKKEKKILFTSNEMNNECEQKQKAKTKHTQHTQRVI